MKNVLTFIIPVRHQNNSQNWLLAKERLTQTVRSISRQDHDGWKAVVVANYGADLPDLPEGFEVKRVDFPPNELHAQGAAGQEQFREAFRIDKGRRVLAGMLHAGEMGHVMIVDDDDFVSRRLVSFVAANSSANGWYVREGFIWTDRRNLFYLYSDFSRLCGTSHIIRSDLYRLPLSAESADDADIRRKLGSHIYINDDLDAAGTPLLPLPFVGAVYRSGHSGAHSRSNGILRQYFFRRAMLKRPVTLARQLLRLQIKTQHIEEEFFGRPTLS